VSPTNLIINNTTQFNGKDNMVYVEVRNGNLEKALRVLKKKVQKSGLVKELRAREYYQKPSEIKREKKKEGIKNYKKKMKKLEQMR
jgi:small subunit ribosomal protein S21